MRKRKLDEQNAALKRFGQLVDNIDPTGICMEEYGRRVLELVVEEFTPEEVFGTTFLEEREPDMSYNEYWRKNACA